MDQKLFEALIMAKKDQAKQISILATQFVKSNSEIFSVKVFNRVSQEENKKISDAIDAAIIEPFANFVEKQIANPEAKVFVEMSFKNGAELKPEQSAIEKLQTLFPKGQSAIAERLGKIILNPVKIEKPVKEIPTIDVALETVATSETVETAAKTTTKNK